MSQKKQPNGFSSFDSYCQSLWPTEWEVALPDGGGPIEKEQERNGSLDLRAIGPWTMMEVLYGLNNPCFVLFFLLTASISLVSPNSPKVSYELWVWRKYLPILLRTSKCVWTCHWLAEFRSQVKKRTSCMVHQCFVPVKKSSQVSTAYTCYKKHLVRNN